MDRRTFVTAGIGMAAFGGTLVGLGRHGSSSDVRKKTMTSAALTTPMTSTLILVDAELAESRAYAERFDTARRVELACAPDVGALWHGRLRDWPGPISGALRPSDCFVLRTYSLAQGRLLRFMTLDATAGACAAAITPAPRTAAFLIEATLPRAARGA
jgi:hypothetical protein